MEIEQSEATEGHVFDGDKHMITLFPLGNFQFPKDKTDVLFEILGITEDSLKSLIKSMIEQRNLPVINCLPLKIEKEGPLRGMREERGIQSTINVNRIRRNSLRTNFQGLTLILEYKI